MKSTWIGRAGCYIAVIGLAAGLLTAPAWAKDDEKGSTDKSILMEYVGQVINGNPTPTSSNQFGNLLNVAGVAPSLHLAFCTQATTVSTVVNGPLRIIDREGTTTIYLVSTPGDFSNPDSFCTGIPVQVSTLRQQVIVSTHRLKPSA
jgi:hypothetical protein